MELYRHSFKITFAVWKALLLREALARLFSRRGAWFWLLAEPIAHMIFIGFLYSVIRQRTIGGIDTLLWLVIGIQGFFLFRRTGSQMAGAIDANRALFSYRQVLPIDTVLVRGVLELILAMAVIAIVMFGLMMLGHTITPYDPLSLLGAFLGLWLLGIAWGLVVSALAEVAPELRQVLNLAFRPLYLISGVMFPITNIPEPYRSWLLLNPIVHGLDGGREAFAPFYHSAPDIRLSYLFECAGVGIFVGLLLHRRFSNLMVTR